MLPLIVSPMSYTNNHCSFKYMIIVNAITQRVKTTATYLAALPLLLSGAMALAQADAISTKAKIKLASHCPPSFELTQGNHCELRTVYQFYSSLQGRGVGGTQTALPPHKDGYSPQQIDLGRYLFFDPILSANQKQSCASCHQPELGFSDALPRSIGFEGKELKRAAPTLWNSAFLTSFFWDARSNSLEDQAKGPLYAEGEMNNTPKELLARLNKSEEYTQLFKQAFLGRDRILEKDLTTALAAFQASLISLNSRYDQYVHGNHQALNDNEIAGLNVFRSFVARCSECHTPPLFTNNQVAVIGTPEPEGHDLDIGAEEHFKSKKLKAGFKVPTLRNIAKTAPYMHSGVFENLKDATEFYNKGRGHAVPKGVDLQIHWHIWEPDLQDSELDLIVSFMKTLNDETFMPVTPTHLPSGLAVLDDIKNQ